MSACLPPFAQISHSQVLPKLHCPDPGPQIPARLLLPRQLQQRKNTKKNPPKKGQFPASNAEKSRNFHFFRAANGTTDQRLIKLIILLPGQGWERLEHPLPQRQHGAEPHLEAFTPARQARNARQIFFFSSLFVLEKKIISNPFHSLGNIH